MLPITNQWARKEHLEHKIEGVHKAHTGRVKTFIIRSLERS